MRRIGLTVFLVSLVTFVLPRVSSADEKEMALAWLKQFRAVQVLFNDKDLARVEEKLLSSNTEQAQQWWERTAEVRAALDSERWQTTREALREFLRVQAIYSDEQLEEFRQELTTNVKESPQKFISMLLDIEARHQNLKRQHRQSEQLRKQTLAVNEHFVQQQFDARQAAARQAAQQAQAARRSGSSGSPPPRRRGYTPPPPLVNSLDVARYGVMRSIFPRW